MSKNIRALSARLELSDNLFRHLNPSGKASGPQSDEALRRAASSALLTPAVTYGTASFYDFLQPENAGRKTWTCAGTACLVSGTIAPGCKSAGKAQCVGYCHSGGGLLARDGKGHFSTHHFDGRDVTQLSMPVYNFSESGILTGEAGDVAALYDTALRRETGEIVAELKASGLRGRGGAGFAFAFKLAATAAAKGARKYIVCNADEGDPGAFSDRYLLEQQPHKVMAGMYAAAIAAGADSAVLYIRREYPEAIAVVQKAILDYERLQDDIASRVKFHIVEGAGSYVCGEETALLNSIEGNRPEVRTRPPYPAEAGLWGRPTLVSNVETFANIPWILQRGGAAFAAIGTPASTGTKLLSLSSLFVRPGLYEVDCGASFGELLHEHAGGFITDIKALQVGGPLGSVIPPAQAEALTVDFESFAEAGFALGHAGVIAIPESFPMLDFLRHLFDYMADESCGKCTPCRVGTARGAELLAAASQKSPASLPVLNDLLELLQHGSLCALGGGLPLPVRNCLEHFRPELESAFSGWEDAS